MGDAFTFGFWAAAGVTAFVLIMGAILAVLAGIMSYWDEQEEPRPAAPFKRDGSNGPTTVQ